ncbi:histidine phosphatase superfamily [Podospora didyma]|uniref:Histidine phosphatase superfamily n=1 Tax=Podospora didyma TaxID=330526 RepID=A0AAE0U0Z8_9PEZI|nr:histidine phosphatase superfamily [Podospora didyma]
MRIFFIRHGETVANVAGVYAGVSDSPLTAHGVLQAKRLGAHLAARAPTVVRIFSSDLQRAANTAQAVIDAQALKSSGILDREPLRLVKLPDLRERDFRSAEGKRHGTPHPDAETYAEMHRRAERFIETRLAPILCDEKLASKDVSMVVVAHGQFLSFLVRDVLARFAPKELARLADHNWSLWGNTGYMEAVVKVTAPSQPAAPAEGVSSSSPPTNGTSTSTSTSTNPPHKGWAVMSVVKVNAQDHLEGLKRTRGGIGSAQFDSKQKTLDSFVRPNPKKRMFEAPPGDGL